MRAINENELTENFRKYKNFEGTKEEETESTESIKISTKKTQKKRNVLEGTRKLQLIRLPKEKLFWLRPVDELSCFLQKKYEGNIDRNRKRSRIQEKPMK